MSVKIIILRRVPIEKEQELKPLLLEMRGLCRQKRAYIGGETLLNADDPTECLVISSWDSLEGWNQWLVSEKRANLQGQIDDLLGEPTVYQVYYNA